MTSKDVMTQAQRELNQAVFYALKHGCFFPVPEPKPQASVRDWIQWGAMRNLHNKIAAFDREKNMTNTDSLSPGQ